jgi:dolichol-phosphate mannosyltransferase
MAAFERMNQTLIVVPTYNEKENLSRIVNRLLSLPVPVDVLIVDGNSTDGTAQIADDLAAKHPEIHVLHEKEKRGLGRAYISSFKWALQHSYEYIFEMDADSSHNPDDIPHFLEAAHSADLVLGSRYVGGIRIINWPLKRLMLSKAAANYVRIILGMPFTDPTGGYKCFRRGALEAIDLDAVRSNGYSFQIEMTHKIWRQGLRVVEVPIIFTERMHGRSKMSGNIIREALIRVWQLLFENKLSRRPRPKKKDEDKGSQP